MSRHEVATDLSTGLQPWVWPCRPTRSVRAIVSGCSGEMARPDSVALSGHAPIQPGPRAKAWLKPWADAWELLSDRTEN
jgi:hypothetical protein